MPRLLVKVLVVSVVLCGTAAGLVGYAFYSWHAAQAAVKDNRLEDARSSLRVCLLVWPRSVPVHILAARAARYDGGFEEAEKHLNLCLKLAKGSTPEIQVEFLLIRVQRGEEDEVASELLQYVEGGYAEATLILETLARAYMRNLRHGPAYNCLTRWTQLAPDSAEPYQWRGWVLERLNDLGGAMKDYQKALELDPDLVSVRLRLAELHLEHTNIDDAIPQLELLSEQFPERADVKARLGQCRILQGRQDEARRLLESAVLEMPEDTAVLIHLCKLEMQDNNMDKAEQWIRRALKVDPTDTEAEYTLRACLESTGRLKEAAEVTDQWRKHTAMLQRASKIIQAEAEHPSNDPDPLSEIGTTYLSAGNVRVGLYWLQRALQRDPKHQPTHKALAEYYESKGEKEKAAEHRRQLKPTKAPAAAGTAQPLPEQGGAPRPGN